MKELGGFIQGVNAKNYYEIRYLQFTENKSESDFRFIPDVKMKTKDTIGEFHTHLYGDTPSKQDDWLMYFRSLFFKVWILGIMQVSPATNVAFVTFWEYKRFKKRKFITRTATLLTDNLKEYYNTNIIKSLV